MVFLSPAFSSLFCQNEDSLGGEGGLYLNEMGRVLLSTPTERANERDSGGGCRKSDFAGVKQKYGLVILFADFM